MDPALLTPQEQSQQFLELLWADAPDDHFFYLWTLPDKKTYWYSPTPDGIARASAFIGRIHDTHQVYVGVATSPTQRGEHRRILAAEVSGIAGLWADIDFAGGAHKKPNLPPTADDARTLLEEALPAPTVLVHSGHGLQGWWLFDKPWVFSDSVERGAAALLAKSWNEALHAVAVTHGWTVDATHDLARVMRMPGSRNLKIAPGTDVSILALDGAIRYDASSMREVLGAPSMADLTSGAVSSPLDTAGGDITFVFNRDAVPPFKKWEALKRADKNVSLTAERKRRDMADQSPSGYDMALANFCAIGGWLDQEIADLLVWHRSEHGDSLKADNLQYYARTIRRARETAARAVGVKNIGAVLEQMRESPAPPATDDPGDPNDPNSHAASQQALLDWLTPIFRVGILRAERYAQDPALYRLETAHGWVVLGGASDILDQVKIRGKVLDVTKTVIPRVKADEWDKVAEAIVKAAVHVDMGPEPTTLGAIAGSLREYFEQNPLGDTEFDESAIITKAPFFAGSEVYLNPRSLLNWLNRYENERFSMKEITMRLRMFGAEPTKVNVVIDGRPSSRAVWMIPFEKINALGGLHHGHG